MNTQFLFELYDDETNQFFSTVVASPAGKILERAGDVLSVLPEMMRQAIWQVSSSEGDFKDKLENLSLAVLSKEGETRRFVFNAIYPRDGGNFGDEIMAVDEVDAEISGLMTMASNMEINDPTLSELDNYCDDLFLINVIDVVHEPRSRHDVENALIALYTAVKNGSDVEESLNNAEELLREIDRLPEISTAPSP